jgi:hypothetical protein
MRNQISTRTKPIFNNKQANLNIVDQIGLEWIRIINLALSIKLFAENAWVQMLRLMLKRYNLLR